MKPGEKMSRTSTYPAHIDPSPLRRRLQYRVRHGLGTGAVVETGHDVAAFHDGRDEFPGEVISEHRARLALRRIARAARRFEEFRRHGDFLHRSAVLAN